MSEKRAEERAREAARYSKAWNEASEPCTNVVIRNSSVHSGAVNST